MKQCYMVFWRRIIKEDKAILYLVVNNSQKELCDKTYNEAIGEDKGSFIKCHFHRRIISQVVIFFYRKFGR